MRKYKQSEKITILKLLEKNKFNYSKTSKEMCTSRSTLMQWKKKYGSTVFSDPSPEEQAIAEIDAELKQNDYSIIRKYYIMRKRVLSRILKAAQTEENTARLISILRYVNGEIEKFAQIDREKEEREEEERKREQEIKDQRDAFNRRRQKWLNPNYGQ